MLFIICNFPILDQSSTHKGKSIEKTVSCDLFSQEPIPIVPLADTGKIDSFELFSSQPDPIVSLAVSGKITPFELFVSQPVPIVPLAVSGKITPFELFISRPVPIVPLAVTGDIASCSLLFLLKQVCNEKGNSRNKKEEYHQILDHPLIHPGGNLHPGENRCKHKWIEHQGPGKCLQGNNSIGQI